ncbi:site-specific integrase [Candidiatus Paracoxiella cheracis]|uniref:site-specific integrase n=1 Tax=Candidiatus Paracoxiella cheracis TaxID=3405120 RepID=UPI003BF5F3CF
MQINNKKDVIACHSAADDLEDVYYEPDVIDQQASMSESTRRAYYSDLQDFLTKTGRALPTDIESVLQYLEACTDQVNPRTLRRRLSMIRKWHQLHRMPDPTHDLSIKEKITAIARTHGTPKVKAKALRLPALLQLIAYLETHSSLLYIRNKALLLIGYFGAFRRSELVNLVWESIDFVPEGMTIQLPRSKTDQSGEGFVCAIPFGPDHYCPVRALLAWRDASGQYEGYLFRQITNQGKVLESPISSHHWNNELKRLAHHAKLPNAEQITSHSLRRGSTTEAASRGAPLMTLKQHGRWRSGNSVLEYIEEGRRFKDSAAKLLFDF